MSNPAGTAIDNDSGLEPAGDEPPRRNPDWPRQAWRALAGEVLGYLSLVWQSTRAPYRFYAEWAAGERRVLNPLGAMLNAVGVIGVWRIVYFHWRAVQPPDEPWWLELLTPLFAVANYCLFGLLCHGALWLFGARGPLRTTIGAVLYCTSGPLTLLTLVMVPLSAPLLRDRALLAKNPLLAADLPYLVCLWLGAALTWVAIGFALAAAQQRRGWRAVLPILIMIPVQVGFGFAWRLVRS